MPYTSGRAQSLAELKDIIVGYVTDPLIHAADAWELVQDKPFPYGAILKAHGRDEGEIQYIGLLPNSIVKGESYADWFFTYKNVRDFFVWNSAGLNKAGKSFTFTRSGVVVEGVSYSFAETPDIFESSANVLHFGVFKQFSDGLQWDEMPGGINYNLCDTVKKPIPYRPVMYRAGTSTARSTWIPATYPGVGYPCLALNPDEPGDEFPLDGYFDYWLIKKRKSLQVIIRTKENDSLTGGIYQYEGREKWEHIFVGQFEPYDNGEYGFPAIITGGTSGLTMKGRDIRLNPSSTSPGASIGIQVDYNTDNWAFCHGITPFSCVPIDSPHIPSQTMVMLPDGNWQGFANYVQGVQAIPSNFCSNEILTSYSYVQKEPVLSSAVAHKIRPTEQYVYDFYNLLDMTVENEIRYKLEPIELVQDFGERQGIFGQIKDIYYPTQPINKYGQVQMNGEQFLILPNVWEDRQFHYTASVGKYNEYDPETLMRNFYTHDKRSKNLNMIVRLEV